MLSKEGLEGVTKDYHKKLKISIYLKDTPYRKVSSILNGTIKLGKRSTSSIKIFK